MGSVTIFENRNDVREKIFAIYNRSPEIVEQDVESIRIWLAKQPHLPEVPEDALIERLLTMNKYYVEATKPRLDMYYTVKSLLPELYSQHPCSEAAKVVEQALYFIHMPDLRPNLSRLVIWKLKDTNPDNFDALSFFSYFLSVAEIRLREDMSLNDVYVCDLEGATLSHMTKLTPVLLKKLNFLIEKVFPLRTSAVYVLNAPSFVDTFVTMVSRYIKPKLIQRITFCKDVDELYRAIPKSDLPKDFGGTLLSLHEYQNLWRQKFEQSTLLFDHLMTLRVDEKLRPGKPLDSDVLGIQGNFRQLALD